MKEPNIFEETVPGRLSDTELRAMALRQQQQIEAQHQLLAAKEQRLRFLKAQEVRGAATAAEGERLRRLRERVEAQESKLRRLRALRGQVDLQKTYNVTLSNDLDSIRALFSEKEKELSLAVAKVEALTRQLEELRRDRRGPLNLIPGNNQQNITSSAVLELDKLRRELMYRNQLSLQQDARLHLQREALQQRQAELRSVDQRILELQNRLHKKKTSNLILQTQNQNQQLNDEQTQQHTQHQQQQQQHHQLLQQQFLQHKINQQQQQIQHQNSILNNNNNSSIALQILTNNKQNSPLKPSSSVYPSQRIIARGNNVAAVEPYMHTPQKSIAKSVHQPKLQQGQALKKLQPEQQQQLIQDLSNLNLNLHQNNINIKVNHLTTTTTSSTTGISSTFPESDETKILRQQNSKDLDNELLIATTTASDAKNTTNELKSKTLPYQTKFGLTKSESSGTIPISHSTTYPSNAVSVDASHLGQHRKDESDNEKSVDSVSRPFQQPTTVHSIPLSAVNKSVSLISTQHEELTASTDGTSSIRSKTKHQIPSGNLIVPPRKPISSVAPTTISTVSAKNVTHSPKVHMVAPNVTSTPIVSTTESDKLRPALPPKPNKSNIDCNDATIATSFSSVPTVVSVINKPPMSEPTQQTNSDNQMNTQTQNTDNLPIKARPLTIKKQPLSEQPRLRTNNSTGNSNANGMKPMQYSSRRIEMPPAFLFPEIEKGSLKDDKSGCNGNNEGNSPNGTANCNQSTSSISSFDQTDKSTASSLNDDEPLAITTTNVQRRTRTSLLSRHRLDQHSKVKLIRRVSFDPLALLLDASLEGELELVKKTTMQVPNPSAANDEGITALHNAICAGHFAIVKFLVEYGCDVNAQDSDGWTPLHCAASCNNLEMVKFLVESGACLFAATLSDHETPAEKCEEDEEGFDGCSEYLYSIQEKLGILNNGEVYAVFAYDSQQQDELSFDVNDRITVLRKGDDAEREWWWAKLESIGREGYIPRNLLGLYARLPLQHQAD